MREVRTGDRPEARGERPSHYPGLLVDSLVNGVVMYLVMYVMIDNIGHFYPNINQLYMTIMMLSPMVVLMLFRMGAMYDRRRLNLALTAILTLAFFGSFVLIRTQTPVGDEEFLRSMIPHHSGAILMCEEASIEDAEIADLCGRIVTSQEQEIAEMERILQRS